MKPISCLSCLLGWKKTLRTKFAQKVISKSTLVNLRSCLVLSEIILKSNLVLNAITGGRTIGQLPLSVIGSLRNHDDDGNKKVTNFAYLIVKNNSFARFARAVFIFDFSLMFSFFLRREMTCFAVVWTTWPYDDKRSILSSYLRSTASNLIPR